MIAGVVYALVLPIVALTTVYVYADCRAREALQEEAGPAVAPARARPGLTAADAGI